MFQVIQCVSLPPRNGSSGGHPLQTSPSYCASGLLMDPAFYKYVSQKHDFQASANILQNILLVAAAGLRCVLRSYCVLLVSPNRTPTFSTSPLKSCFPFFSLPPLLSQFSLLSSFSFSPLPSFSALSSILILICFFSPLHSCISLLLSCPLVPTLSLFPLPAPGNWKLWKARSPGIHQHRLRVFLVMGAEGQGAFAL